MAYWKVGNGYLILWTEYTVLQCQAGTDTRHLKASEKQKYVNKSVKDVMMSKEERSPRLVRVVRKRRYRQDQK